MRPAKSATNSSNKSETGGVLAGRRVVRAANKTTNVRTRKGVPGRVRASKVRLDKVSGSRAMVSPEEDNSRDRSQMVRMVPDVPNKATTVRRKARTTDSVSRGRAAIKEVAAINSSSEMVSSKAMLSRLKAAEVVKVAKTANGRAFAAAAMAA